MSLLVLHKMASWRRHPLTAILLHKLLLCNAHSGVSSVCVQLHAVERTTWFFARESVSSNARIREETHTPSRAIPYLLPITHLHTIKPPVTYEPNHHTTQLENLRTIFQVCYILLRSRSPVYDGMFPKKNNLDAMHKNSILPVSLLCTWLQYKTPDDSPCKLYCLWHKNPTATRFFNEDKILSIPRSAGQVCLKAPPNF